MFRRNSRQVAEYILFAGGFIAIVFMVLVFLAASVNNYMDGRSISRPSPAGEAVSIIETHSHCIAKHRGEVTA